MLAERISVAFDATSLIGNPTGVGSFAAESLAGLAKVPDLDMAAFALTWRGRGQLGDVLPDGVHVRTRPAPARPLRQLWLRDDFPPIEWWTGKVDLIHGSNYVVPPTRRAATLASVFDLTPIHFPELSTRDTLQYPRLVAHAIRRGAWIHTCSEYTADEIRTQFVIDPDHVVVVPAGVSPAPSTETRTPESAAVRSVCESGSPYLLALGTVEPRKDLPALVAAFDLLAVERGDLRLVVAGPDGWGTDAFDRAMSLATNRNRIDRIGWVTSRDRSVLLARATALVYPSRYEGFGLPPLEAMAAATPVVTTDAGSLPEVLGDAATFVSAQLLAEDRQQGIRALADAIGATLDESPETRQDRITAGQARAAGYNWERTVEGLADLYRRIAATRA